MKTILTFILALTLLQTFAYAGIEADISKENRVILTLGAWTPSAEETQKALVAIQVFLEKPASTNDWANGEIKKILANTKKYRVQFVGVIRDGKKVIWCNFFPVPQKGEEARFRECPLNS